MERDQEGLSTTAANPGYVVLGVDPGTLVMGYGLIRAQGSEPCVIGYGTLAAPASTPVENRLGLLFTRLCRSLEAWRPDTIAVEEPFVGGNPRSGLAVGQAQALVLVAAYQHGLPVTRYTPSQVKECVTDSGRGAKAQVQQMVRLLLGISETVPADAADALAVAICHLRRQRVAGAAP